ncbi:MAG TPA: peptidylprolyl isomerase [Acidimicrobiia bacterium]|nr:peptidylprolyl isomerase [Acidimicrobiia bacterium]
MARSGARPVRFRRSLISPLALAVAVGLGGAACGKAKPPAVAARVNGTTVPSADVERLTTQYLSASQGSAGQTLAEGAPLKALSRKVGRRYVLEYLIRLELLKQLARDKGVPLQSDELLDKALGVAPDSEFAHSAYTREDLRNGLIAGKLSKQLAERLFPDVAVSDSDVEKHWETVQDRFKAGWSSSIRAAFLPSKAAAETLRQKVKAGAPFDETATGLGAAKAGSMGEVSSSSAELSPELRNLIGTLHKGDLSPPAQAADGYLVFLCEDRQDTPERTLADVRPQVLAAAQDQKRQRLFADWLDERERRATVSVASFYGRWNRERGSVS